VVQDGEVGDRVVEEDVGVGVAGVVETERRGERLPD